ncbi:hypothetical protein BC937DRAFT_92268 [Endogone sp. FLAS-F59071]|nr:hypothetical protein BC937DRAFT_92268 [Endogone sp. FLAS-F59071]|eukprot:RUS21562.1 hypothetical protein BC937DRAFT_92268 [Endogone sp. FLAS-F59071]
MSTNVRNEIYVSNNLACEYRLLLDTDILCVKEWMHSVSPILVHPGRMQRSPTTIVSLARTMVGYILSGDTIPDNGLRLSGGASSCSFYNMEPISNPQKEINILLMGETGVGKSTFINAFAN